MNRVDLGTSEVPFILQDQSADGFYNQGEKILTLSGADGNIKNVVENLDHVPAQDIGRLVHAYSDMKQAVRQNPKIVFTDRDRAKELLVRTLSASKAMSTLHKTPTWDMMSELVPHSGWHSIFRRTGAWMLGNGPWKKFIRETENILPTSPDVEMTSAQRQEFELAYADLSERARKRAVPETILGCITFIPAFGAGISLAAVYIGGFLGVGAAIAGFSSVVGAITSPGWIAAGIDWLGRKVGAVFRSSDTPSAT